MRLSEYTILLVMGGILIGCKAEMKPANDRTPSAQSQAVSHTALKPAFEQPDSESPDGNGSDSPENFEPEPTAAPEKSEPQEPIEVDIDTLELVLKPLARTWGVDVEKERKNDRVSESGN